MDPATAKLIAQMIKDQLRGAMREQPQQHQASMAQPPMAQPPMAQLQQQPAMPAHHQQSQLQLSQLPTTQFQTPIRQAHNVDHLSLEDSAGLSRSNSHSSTSGYITPPSSSSSAGPPPLRRYRQATHDDFYQTDDDGPMNPAQRLAVDRRRIRVAILQYFDANWLAPKRSQLFHKAFRKQKDSNGNLVRKKNEDMIIPLFNRLVRTALRNIMGQAYMNDLNLMSRYRLAAKKIVTKRRANHMQAWRLTGKHKALIYGDGKKGNDGKKDKGRCLKKKAKKKKIAAHKLFDEEGNYQEEPSVSKMKVSDEMPDEEPSVSKMKVSDEMPDEDCLSEPDFSDEMPEEDESQIPEEDDEKTPDDDDAKKVSPKLPRPPVSGMKLNKTACADCKKRLEFHSCFPQDHEDWAPSIRRPVRCGDCWDNFIQTQVMPEMDARIHQQSIRKRKGEELKQQSRENVDKESKKKKNASVARSVSVVVPTTCPRDIPTVLSTKGTFTKRKSLLATNPKSPLSNLNLLRTSLRHLLSTNLHLQWSNRFPSKRYPPPIPYLPSSLLL